MLVGEAAPVDTTKLTGLPRATLMPATGLWLMTLPAGTVALVAWVIVPTVRATPWIAVIAAAWVKLTTLGTRTLVGGAVPEDTTKSTGLPRATLMPATGLWLMTLPAATVALVAWVMVPMVKPAP